jgi:hypothetical protein
MIALSVNALLDHARLEEDNANAYAKEKGRIFHQKKSI